MGEEEERGALKEELLSEVFVSEVLANLSVVGECVVAGGLGSGEEERDRSNISGSSPWKTL